MKTELEKIKELKRWTGLNSERLKRAKAIREKAENGCVADWDENGYECFPDSLCPTCQEIIKIAKEIEK